MFLIVLILNVDVYKIEIWLLKFYLNSNFILEFFYLIIFIFWFKIQTLLHNLIQNISVSLEITQLIQSLDRVVSKCSR